MKRKNVIRFALVTLGILLIPLVLTLLGSGVDGEGWHWTFFDFVFMGTILFGSGLAYEFVASRSSNITYRYAVGMAVMTALLLVYVNAAVGIIGEDNGSNLMYFGVLAAGFIGAFIVRFQPCGMSRTLFSMAFATALIPVVVLIFWKEQLDFPPGVLGVFVLNTIFVALFAGSALLFRRAGITPRESASQ